MKRCPTCQKTFADTMKFCQTDGTPLVEDAPPADPFKTVVGGSVKEDDILQIPDSYDPMKTMVSAPNAPKPDEPKRETASKESASESFPKSDSMSFVPPSRPSEPPPNPPPFGDSSPQSGSTSSGTTKPKSFDATFSGIEPPSFGAGGSSSSPFDKPSDAPFGSPPPNDEPPPTAFGGSAFEPPKSSPPYKEPEPFNAGQSPYSSPQTPPSNDPFGTPQKPFAEPNDPWGAPQNAPFGNQPEWTPPPAPVSEWQNQGIGADTPFQPPMATSGQNQTLAIVSLVLGIISIPCCGFVVFGIGAAITGFLAKKKADENPGEYGGRGLALAGMIIGLITGGIGLILLILQILFGILGSLPR